MGVLDHILSVAIGAVFLGVILGFGFGLMVVLDTFTVVASAILVGLMALSLSWIIGESVRESLEDKRL